MEIIKSSRSNLPVLQLKGRFDAILVKANVGILHRARLRTYTAVIEV